MRLIAQGPPSGRAWDRLLLAEEVDDVVADCARLEASGDAEGIFAVLATLDQTVSAEVWTRLQGPHGGRGTAPPRLSAPDQARWYPTTRVSHPG